MTQRATKEMAPCVQYKNGYYASMANCLILAQCVQYKNGYIRLNG